MAAGIGQSTVNTMDSDALWTLVPRGLLLEFPRGHNSDYLCLELLVEVLDQALKALNDYEARIPPLTSSGLCI